MCVGRVAYVTTGARSMADHVRKKISVGKINSRIHYLRVDGLDVRVRRYDCGTHMFINNRYALVNDRIHSLLTIHCATNHYYVQLGTLLTSWYK